MTLELRSTPTDPTKSVYPALVLSTTVNDLNQYHFLGRSEFLDADIKNRSKLDFSRSKNRPIGMSGSGLAVMSCGDWKYHGCKTPHKNVEGEGDPKVFVRRSQNTCGRLLCPVCYLRVANRIARRGEHRFKTYFMLNGGKTVLHVELGYKTKNLPYKMARKILRYLGIKGEALIDHPWRGSDKKGWREGPHLHAVCVGWLLMHKVPYVYRKFKIQVKVIPAKKRSAFGTIKYLLTHAVSKSTKWVEKVHEKTRTLPCVRWSGCLSYNKFKVDKPKLDKMKCPICNEPLERVYRCSDELSNGWFNNEGWFNPQDWCGRDGRTIDEG